VQETKAEAAPAPIINKVPIDPADESWGMESSDKGPELAPPEPIIDDEFEPDIANLKDKKRDESRDLAMPPKKEEKPAYIPKKVPLIDPNVWRRVPIVPSALVENAVDNKLNNLLEDIFLEYHNIERNLYKDVKKINKELKSSQKIKDLDFKSSINKISDLSDLQDSKSMRES
jgi:hypothetical protein